MLKKEITYFLTALMFFTRIPIPFKISYSNEIMNQSQKYYAAIGLLVGALNAFIYGICQFIFPIDIAIILTMITSILLTGAFHEDGFTDVCDSFGGGYGKEKILTIMKDSRIGAYGVIGVVLLLLLKFTSLVHLAENNFWLMIFTLITAHSVSRFFSGMMIYTHEYVTDIDKSKSKPMANKALPIKNLIISFIFCLTPFVIFGKWTFLLILPFCYLGNVYLGWYFKKYIGGYTGDCLGTVQQVTEALFYLGILILCRFL
ncbi:adenosylcobinamide-GDP ribazoletransferase [Empedobacter brevis]|uniref:Adenosylcobinamide-GDP ribazoletransferase n=1 Tax=Empedobacter brevis NBRC 14943 = ATCC 43319 TaxID=1218108 RepID=A0A511NMR5_9FLAO|nr:adenosylcobinamide-GDP ribazoletransferase [Empedobacter brevis]GEM53748.1 adenosylcobinamide-GDP ribazoletransferase [Empedobacter brevis NBRC 14943 = ATCC 43319]